MNRRPSRGAVRPTLFGAVLFVVLIAAWVLRPPVADPSVAGFVFAGLAGALLLGAFVPLLVVALVRVEVSWSPSDLIAGELESIEVHLKGPGSGLTLSIDGSVVTATDVVSPSTALIPVRMQRRGIHDEVTIALGSDGPFGVMWAMRHVTVPLPSPMYVGPASLECDVDLGLSATTPNEVVSIHGDTTGETARAVRPYVAGDPAHWVHWPSTARTGSLVVREFEPPSELAVAIVVDLGAAGVAQVVEAEDAAVGRAAGMVESSLARGGRVVLCTSSPSGPVATEVPDMVSANRQLAAATAGSPAAAPIGWTQVRAALASEPNGN